MSDGEKRLHRVAGLFGHVRFHFTSEAELQAGIGQVLRAAGVDYEPEVVLSRADRIDFLCPDGVGIEVKTKGSYGDAARQLSRYATHERIGALLLVTNRVALTCMPLVLGGKPVRVLALLGGLR